MIRMLPTCAIWPVSTSRVGSVNGSKGAALYGGQEGVYAPIEMKAPSHAIIKLGLLALLGGTVILTFAHSMRGGFVWDDIDLIASNRYVKDFRYLERNFTHSFWETARVVERDRASWANIYYRPLVTLSFMVDYWLYGMKPWGFHLTNVLLHLMVVVLVFHLGQRLMRPQGNPLAAYLMPTMAALLFAVHPSRVEAVTWVSGRGDVMMALFFLLALLAFWRTLHVPRRRFVWLVGGWLAYVAAILCKEAAVALAVIVPFMDGLLINRGDSRRWWKNVGWCHLPLVVITFGFVVIRLVLQTLELGYKGAGLDLWGRVVLFLYSLAHYGLAVVIPYSPSTQIGAFVDPRTPSWELVFLGGMVIVVGTVGAWFAWKQRKHTIAFLIIVTAATLAPVANIVPLTLISLVAERFLYLPFVALALLMAIGFVHLTSRLGKPTVVLVLVGMLSSSWALTSSLRTRDYADELRFWSVELSEQPNNPQVQLNLALALARQKRYKAAEDWFFRSFHAWRRIRRGADRQMNALFQLLEVRLLRTSDLDEAFLRNVVQFLSNLIEAAEASSATRKGASLDLGQGKLLTLEIRRERVRASLLDRKAFLLDMAGNVYSRLGDDARAVEMLTLALRSNTENVGTVLNLALAHIRARQLGSARDLLARARVLALDEPEIPRLERVLDNAAVRLQALQGVGPDSARAHGILAELFILTKAPGRACRHLREVIRLDPGDRGARAKLALELAASGGLQEALGVLEQARAYFGPEPGLSRLEREVRRIYAERSARVRSSAGWR